MNLSKINDSSFREGENFNVEFENSRFERDYLNKDEKFRYMLLNRMQLDCEYYLGYGHRWAPNLWAGNEEDQIKDMVSLWNSLKEKPKWLSKEEIQGFCNDMCNKNVEELT